MSIDIRERLHWIADLPLPQHTKQTLHEAAALIEHLTDLLSQEKYYCQKANEHVEELKAVLRAIADGSCHACTRHSIARCTLEGKE